MDIPDKKINIEFSTNSIIKILIIVLVLWILYLIKDVLAILFFSLILVSILEPIVSWFSDRKVPKSLAVLFIYLILVSLAALVVVLLIPPITAQINHLSQNFPQYWQQIRTEFANVSNFFNEYGILHKIESSLGNYNFQWSESTGGLFSKLGNFVAGFFSIIVVLVITFYILVEESAIKRILRSLMPSQYLPYTYQLVNRIQKKLGLWLRGQLILGFIIFLLVYLALSISGVKYALILAILAGTLEFIPYLGPILSGFVAVFIVLFQSPWLALWVLILYIIIQFLENHIFVPMVMKKTVGLNPVVSIVALLIGGKLGGVIGIILAIPVAAALSVFIQDFLDKKKEEDYRLA